jgi:Tfx family DNA-binding protein
MGTRKDFPYGLFSVKQFEVLKLRSTGLTQREIAGKLGMSRASVSMVESRAMKRLELAKRTLEAYSSIRPAFNVKIKKGTKLYDVPSLILGAADKQHVRVRSNIVEIIRMVKFHRPQVLDKGKINQELVFALNPDGGLRLLD